MKMLFLLLLLSLVPSVLKAQEAAQAPAYLQCDTLGCRLIEELPEREVIGWDTIIEYDTTIVYLPEEPDTFHVVLNSDSVTTPGYIFYRIVCEGAELGQLAEANDTLATPIQINGVMSPGYTDDAWCLLNPSVQVSNIDEMRVTVNDSLIVPGQLIRDTVVRILPDQDTIRMEVGDTIQLRAVIEEGADVP